MTTRTTTRAIQRSGPAGLQSLARRFLAWRATRTRGQRIPAELWQAATAMAKLHGIAPTVAALKINYYDLQRRLHRSEGGHRESPPEPVFVEVPPVVLPPGGRGVVELVHAGGARLVLHRNVAGSGELLALAELFLRHGR